jgi:hypothetical protein
VRRNRRNKKKVGQLVNWARPADWGWPHDSKHDTGIVVHVYDIADSGFIDVLFGDSGIVRCIASDYEVINEG